MFNFCMCVVGAEWGRGEEVIMIFYAFFRGQGKGWKADHTWETRERACSKSPLVGISQWEIYIQWASFFFPNNKINSSILIIHWYEALIIKANSMLTWAKYLANTGFLWKQVKREHFRKRSDGPRYVLIEERMRRNALGLSLAIGLQLPLGSSSPIHPHADPSSPNPPHPSGYLSSWSRLGTFILSLPGQGKHP